MVQITWAVREEYARTVEDVLSRRTRALILDASASLEAAPAVARLMAQELGKDVTWEGDQVRAYSTLASNYTVDHLQD
jgi:glycerol-3-phosphate dehydrogenase